MWRLCLQSKSKRSKTENRRQNCRTPSRRPKRPLERVISVFNTSRSVNKHEGWGRKLRPDEEKNAAFVWATATGSGKGHVTVAQNPSYSIRNQDPHSNLCDQNRCVGSEGVFFFRSSHDMQQRWCILCRRPSASVVKSSLFCLLLHGYNARSPFMCWYL